MLIQVNTDSNVELDQALLQEAQAVVENALVHFGGQLTRVEVHLSDVNSDKKSGTDDLRCVIEARLAGLQPIAVSHQAVTVASAIVGAAEKMKQSLETVRGRLGTR